MAAGGSLTCERGLPSGIGSWLSAGINAMQRAAFALEQLRSDHLYDIELVDSRDGRDIASFLATGELPDGDSAGGSMALVIKNTSRLSDNDRAAMAAYIKSLPPVDGLPHPKK